MRTICLVFASLVAASTGQLQAAPIQLDSAQFATATGGSATVEDFEGFPSGTQANPFVFANGRMTAGSGNPFLIDFFVFGPTQRLLNATIGSVRTIDMFPAGTTLVGLDLFYNSPPDLFDVTVVGGSGTLNLTSQSGTSLGTFLGFQDSLGITSISFQNVNAFSQGQYSFDNFQTAGAASPPPSVPEPTSLALLATGAFGFMGYGWRRKRKLAA